MLSEIPNLGDEFKKAIDEHLELRSTVNRYGERNIDLVSGFAENVEIPETFVDYSANPREYSLSAVQTVVRVHTRVSDLYNGPYDQLEEQMRLTIEGIKERQEWELINNNKFGLIHSADPAMRISTRYGAPTPDDLDELLALVWKKPAFFLAHPKAIAAFERECTWRGVPPVTINLFGTPVITWRGVPLVPCDKLEMKSRYQSNQWFGTTSILLLRVGEADQGVVGLHQAGIPGEISPSLSARLDGARQPGRRLVPADAVLLVRRADRRRTGRPRKRRSRLLPRLRSSAVEGEVGSNAKQRRRTEILSWTKLPPTSSRAWPRGFTTSRCGPSRLLRRERRCRRRPRQLPVPEPAAHMGSVPVAVTSMPHASAVPPVSAPPAGMPHGEIPSGVPIAATPPAPISPEGFSVPGFAANPPRRRRFAGWAQPVRQARTADALHGA